MTVNRSMPNSAVTPVLHYPDVRAAVEWLCKTFGFRERLRIGNHRSQMETGNASLVVAQGTLFYPGSGWPGHSIMVRVPDVDAHHRHSVYSGADVVSRPVTHPYGERQYRVMDIGGHLWTFSQTMEDVDPAFWGGVEVDMESPAEPA